MRVLCVSIHDVAPATLDACRTIAAAVSGVDARIPLTLLIVPRYHGAAGETPPVYRAWIDERLSRGDALALHGYTHRDEAPPARGRAVTRRVYTAGEGEFSALTEAEAAGRIARGRAWLAEHGWRADGFVAPAWLLSDGAWSALRNSGFSYTTTLTGIHALPHGRSFPAPTVVYSARSRLRRATSRVWNAALAVGTRHAQVVRFGFHPADAEHPALMRHAVALLEQIARRREPLTKSECARRLM